MVEYLNILNQKRAIMGQNENKLYITGAGVSVQSGIPTFRGSDGFWMIGSKNFTPQDMASRAMYQNNPKQFLLWYYKRFATYRDHGPNDVHYWLADKNLITQNIDGLDGKAGNQNYISIHGRLDKVTLFHRQGEAVDILDAPWAKINKSELDDQALAEQLLKLFYIEKECPKLEKSLKPYVLLFDEYYTEIYDISKAQERMYLADRIIFIGTSFSVNITQMALEIAASNRIEIEIVDPKPVRIAYDKVVYHKMTALEYINSGNS